jgi:rhodanese-related sulfurtransferase
MVPNADFLRVAQATLPLSSKIVVGCQSGGRSFRAAQILQGVGYADVVDQRAGFGGARDGSGRIFEPGWAAAKLPTESGPSPGRAYLDLEKAALR